MELVTRVEGGRRELVFTNGGVSKSPLSQNSQMPTAERPTSEGVAVAEFPRQSGFRPGLGRWYQLWSQRVGLVIVTPESSFGFFPSTAPGDARRDNRPAHSFSCLARVYLTESKRLLHTDPRSDPHTHRTETFGTSHDYLAGGDTAPPRGGPQADAEET